MKKVLCIFALGLLCACSPDDEPEVTPVPDSGMHETLIVCNQGTMGADNGTLSYATPGNGTVLNRAFFEKNGTKLGDTPMCCEQINDTLIAVSVTGSSIIQFIHPDLKACGATEDVPSCRYLCSDGQYLYATSYAHRCGSATFEKGFVAKIDIKTKRVIATCEVGWEPEGLAYYDGRLYIANTGGYSFSEGHDYESTIDVVRASDMKKITSIETGKKNLFGYVAQTGKYILVNAAGNYIDEAAATVLVDCSSNKVSTFDFSATYASAYDGKFYVLSSDFSYDTYEYTYGLHTIDAQTLTVSDGIYSDEVANAVRSMGAPYSLYVSPYSGYLYITDACDYVSAGKLYTFDREGHQKSVLNMHICPAFVMALPQVSIAE